jgi:transmembrane sensor
MKEEDENYQFTIADIMVLHLLGSATEQQEEVLRQWLKESPSNRLLLEELEDQRQLQKGVEALRDFRQGNSPTGMRNKSDRRSLRLRLGKWTAAASIILVIGGVSWRYLVKSPPNVATIQRQANKDPISPAGHYATLMLADGKQVDLHSGIDSMMMSEGMDIVIKGDSVNYGDGGHIKNPAIHQLFTPNGATYKIKLSDGTAVTLNAGSWIKYPASFPSDHRRVEVSGEVYFDIAADPLRPFTVESKGIRVLALGTSFNVRVYEGDAEIITTLASGMVQVSGKHGSVKLHPAEQARADLQGTQIRTSKVSLQAALGWKNDLFIYQSSPVSDLLKEMERWYGIKVDYKDGFSGRELYTGEISRRLSLTKVVDLLEKTGVGHFKIDGRILSVVPTK